MDSRDLVLMPFYNAPARLESASHYSLRLGSGVSATPSSKNEPRNYSGGIRFNPVDVDKPTLPAPFVDVLFIARAAHSLDQHLLHTQTRRSDLDPRGTMLVLLELAI